MQELFVICAKEVVVQKTCASVKRLHYAGSLCEEQMLTWRAYTVRKALFGENQLISYRGSDIAPSQLSILFIIYIDNRFEVKIDLWDMSIC